MGMNPGDTVVVHVPPKERKRRALVKVAITIGVGLLVGFFGYNTGSSDWREITALIAVIMAIGGFATFRTLQVQTVVEESPEARQRRELAEAEAARKAQERDRKWYVRYPMAALCLWLAYYVATGPKSDRLWWIAIVCVVGAAIQAWEVTAIAVGVALLVGIFYGIASLPVSAAIVIGALIIASALRK